MRVLGGPDGPEPQNGLLYSYKGTNITWERVVNPHRTQLNDALNESYALRGIFPRESLRTNGRGKSSGEKRSESSKRG